MAVTSNPYRGTKGIRYRFMKEHMPDELKRLEQSGELDDYLRKVALNYTARWDELMEPCMKSLGLTLHMKMTDSGKYLTLMEEADRMAGEMAFKEVLEAY